MFLSGIRQRRNRIYENIEDWDQALDTRHTAARNVGFAGFVSFAWAKNAMGVSDDELIHFEQTYRSMPLPQLRMGINYKGTKKLRILELSDWVYFVPLCLDG